MSQRRSIVKRAKLLRGLGEFALGSRAVAFSEFKPEGKRLRRIVNLANAIRGDYK